MSLAFKKLFKPASNYIGALTFTLLFCYLVSTGIQNSNLYLFCFKALKLILIIYLFLSREATKINSGFIVKSISYISSFLPMLYQSNFNGSIPFSLNIICAILFFGGEFLSIAGLITLGKSFGVSPSKRSYVYQGIYSYLNHPIYLGYFISEISILITNYSKLNIFVFLFSTFLYFQRASFENKIHNSPL